MLSFVDDNFFTFICYNNCFSFYLLFENSIIK